MPLAGGALLFSYSFTPVFFQLSQPLATSRAQSAVTTIYFLESTSSSSQKSQDYYHPLSLLVPAQEPICLISVLSQDLSHRAILKSFPSAHPSRPKDSLTSDYLRLISSTYAKVYKERLRAEPEKNYLEPLLLFSSLSPSMTKF